MAVLTKEQREHLLARVTSCYQELVRRRTYKEPTAVTKARATIATWDAEVRRREELRLPGVHKANRAVKQAVEFPKSTDAALKAVEDFERYGEL